MKEWSEKEGQRKNGTKNEILNKYNLNMNKYIDIDQMERFFEEGNQLKDEAMISILSNIMLKLERKP